MILKILAYQGQEELLPEKWEIEHILPQKWQSSYFSSKSDVEVKEVVEHIGNMIPFEKKLNIIASNVYFKKKQESYKKSKVQLLLDLSNQHNDWGLNQSSLPVQDEQFPIPTVEELKMIEELKRKGLI